MKKIIFHLLFSCSTFAFSQSNFGYSIGFSTSFDLLYPKQYETDFEYFTSAYSNGYALNLGVTNKLNYKKTFTRFDFTYNYASQQQTFAFSNAVDLKISHTLRHDVPYYSFDWSIGRDFQLKSTHLLQIELGLSTIFSMSVGPYNLKLRKTGCRCCAYKKKYVIVYCIENGNVIIIGVLSMKRNPKAFDDLI